MKDIRQETEQYLAGFQDSMTPLKMEQADSLPVYLRERYKLYRTRLFGKEWLLAMESGDWHAGTPDEYRQQISVLAETLHTPVVLVLAAASSSLRNRLVRLNLPFIVPGAQVFLPVSFVNMTERHPHGSARVGERLTPTAQVLVLYQVLRGELRELSFKDIAAKLGCSSMMITKARAELESRGICEVERVGKETRMVFHGGSQWIWEKARDSMVSPVAKKCWVQWDQPAASAKRAGMTALGQLTLISDDAVPTFALRRRQFQELLEQGGIRGCPDQHGADAHVECWSYAPGLLSDGPLVDPLSLYLSLRHDPDERVQGELATMMGALQWR